MVGLGIQKIPQFSLLDWEVSKTGPSYTIETITRLKKETGADLFLLLGEDQLLQLHLWKDSEELLVLSTPLIASREVNSPLAALHLPAALQARISEGRTKIPIMEISSTAVRARLRQKKFCGHLVPHLVLDYIERHGLYS
jgi:nicotinate-nucleotide adenylyltransferase